MLPTIVPAEWCPRPLASRIKCENSSHYSGSSKGQQGKNSTRWGLLLLLLLLLFVSPSVLLHHAWRVRVAMKKRGCAVGEREGDKGCGRHDLAHVACALLSSFPCCAVSFFCLISFFF
ncbi:hypothetical protein EDD21DRAFT_91103 [Dissophora ornata]|nr:hypothetical protein EDD21DRAFT_91103 [Dissophora ornata]